MLLSSRPIAQRPPDRPADRLAFDALVQTSYRIQGLLAHHADRHQLSLSQLRLLGILRDREPSMRELAGYLNLEKSSASGLIERAEQRGLVVRAQGADDRRTVTVSLTTAGRTIIGELEHELTEPCAELLAPLSPPERTQLTRLLHILLR